ncbi:hypothetical protein Tdes44962_MAKER04819 [Teratosphaeria destructans]|uniref:Chitin-binding type-2 domain-containing protein n=1 Tax=Teratosphaeria destructans TaxID=418781 RepID=A0A9W7VZU9_9PEZI|nr:hypothetical protein Tdes44962_MAKER04819 [Teratosphaeria destructans]
MANIIKMLLALLAAHAATAIAAPPLLDPRDNNCPWSKRDINPTNSTNIDIVPDSLGRTRGICTNDIESTFYQECVYIWCGQRFTAPCFPNGSCTGGANTCLVNDFDYKAICT